ncbi:hypothetical protein DM01DRAFT_1133829 [Hesseltinella vesiculosa]|uniref:Uncharacterized protein n=1 Tax=Hesseltinella vesiculosa TaxID=101127 RepID=A0A1X2G8P2_9FUNG|nr:hypothetical protein DM01DRAFT_1133829 [Hesseltinella vesiculosa]
MGQAEFGRCVASKKFYHDKTKLLLNGKSQLNDLIKQSHGTLQSCLKLCLVQVLGFEAIVYTLSLEAKGFYVLRRVSTFTFPERSKGLGAAIKVLLKNLMLFKSLCLDSAESFIDSVNHNKKRIRNIICHPSTTPSPPVASHAMRSKSLSLDSTPPFSFGMEKI